MNHQNYEAIAEELDAMAALAVSRHIPARLKTCTLSGLLSADLPEPKAIISPVLFEGDLCMVYGWRGAGKTWVSLSLAYSIAAKVPFLGWPCDQARRVLFLDGEMRAARLKKRLAMIANATLDSAPEPDPDNLHFLTRDMNALADWPDLGTSEGRLALTTLIDSIDPAVIVLDNISAWVRSGKGENDEESWRDVASFLMAQRSLGRAVVLIHHAGKGGAQRGTSKREDILDTVVCLKKPDDYDQTDGLRVQIVFEKARNLDGGEVPSLEVSLNTSDNKARFEVVEAVNDPISIAHKLIDSGASRGEIMAELNISRFALTRLQERAQKIGRGFTLPVSKKGPKNV